MIKDVVFDDDKIQKFYELVSKNVIRIRKERKISQLKLAIAIGHQSSTFVGKAEILVENKHFNLEHLYKISTVLDIDMSEFFRKL